MTAGLSALVTELLADGDGHRVETRQIDAGGLRVPLRALWHLTPAGELVPVTHWHQVAGAA